MLECFSDRGRCLVFMQNIAERHWLCQWGRWKSVGGIGNSIWVEAVDGHMYEACVRREFSSWSRCAAEAAAGRVGRGCAHEVSATWMCGSHVRNCTVFQASEWALPSGAIGARASPEDDRLHRGRKYASDLVRG